jgi:hypothetical protein
LMFFAMIVASGLLFPAVDNSLGIVHMYMYIQCTHVHVCRLKHIHYT